MDNSNTNIDYEKLQEYLDKLNALKPTQSTCPNCGYCPHCGRGGYHTYPSYPYVAPYPWPGGTWITCKTDTNTNG